MMKTIYLDHAATTKPLPEVIHAMQSYYTEEYGNAGGVYGLGAAAKLGLQKARETIAGSLSCSSSEIYFTSGGTEADNWALIGAAEAYAAQGKHIITTKIEHHAVLHTCAYLEERGFAVTYLDVDETGMIDVEAVKRAIRPDTILISVMFANNEIGTIEPIEEIGKLAREHGVLFHTDAVQAYGQVPISLNTLPVDLLSASAHKCGGPKGTGFLYIRKNVKIRSFMHGGQQERSRRAGTENVPAIVGFGVAAETAMNDMEQNYQAEERLRDDFIRRVQAEIPSSKLNGHATRRLPGNVNFSFDGVANETLLILLDRKGICASGGSACTTGSLEASHVLRAIGLSEKLAKSAVRFTLGPENTKEEIDYTVDVLKACVEKLQGMLQ